MLETNNVSESVDTEESEPIFTIHSPRATEEGVKQIVERLVDLVTHKSPKK